MKVEHTAKQVEAASPKSLLLGYLPGIYQEPGTTRMRTPDGRFWDVPNDKVEEAREREAVEVGGEYAAAATARSV